MPELNVMLVCGAIFLAVFVCEAIYAGFFRDFGLVKFRLAFMVPGADAKTVWSTYFDGRNEWNSVTERLTYEVVSERPRVVRSTVRLRGTNDVPVTTEWLLDIIKPERSCRATIVKIDGADVPAAEQTSEVFELTPGAEGTEVQVEAEIPVRGWLRVPMHRRYLSRIFTDLQAACLRKAGVPFRAVERRWWFWTVRAG